MKVQLDGYHFIYEGDTYSGGKWEPSSPYIQLDSDDKIMGEWEEELLEDFIYIANDDLPENLQLTDEEISTGVITPEKENAFKTLVYALVESEVLTLGSNKITPVALDYNLVGATVSGYLAPHLPDAENHATQLYFSAYIIDQIQLHSGGGE